MCFISICTQDGPINCKSPQSILYRRCLFCMCKGTSCLHRASQFQITFETNFIWFVIRRACCWYSGEFRFVFLRRNPPGNTPSCVLQDYVHSVIASLDSVWQLDSFEALRDSWRSFAWQCRPSTWAWLEVWASIPDTSGKRWGHNDHRLKSLSQLWGAEQISLSAPSGFSYTKTKANT